MIKYEYTDIVFIEYWQKYLKAVMKRKIEKLYKQNAYYMLGSAAGAKIPKNIDKELDKWIIDIRLIKKP